MKCNSILVVEDDNDIRSSLRQVLEVMGYRVFEAENGQEALDHLKKIPRPCLILLDLMMPIMNGWEFLKYRGEHDGLATIPVAIVTAAADAKIRATGADVVIKKPIDLNSLLTWVKEFCGEGATP